jgi:hypothetical protein
MKDEAEKTTRNVEDMAGDFIGGRMRKPDASAVARFARQAGPVSQARRPLTAADYPKFGIV